MKKNATLVLIALVTCLFVRENAEAQTQRKIVKFYPDQFEKTEKLNKEDPDERIVTEMSRPFAQQKGAFLAVSLVWYSKNWDDEINSLKMIIHSGCIMGNRFDVHADGHVTPAEGRYVSELYFYDDFIVTFGVRHIGLAQIDSLEIHFFDPGPTGNPDGGRMQFAPTGDTITQFPNTPTIDRSACTCPQPAFEGRLDWCPDGSCPIDPTPEFVPNPTHIIVHHTAGTNTSSDWAAVVRSIWDFHVNTNGWDDIGYNWLVDPNGVLYEGRGDGRLGAHFCAQNGNTTGICVMGDFTTVQAKPAAVNTLEDFLAWETCDENIDPVGTSFHSGSGLTLKNISGHRDGCNTSCPGDMFYPTLPAVREAVVEKIATGCDSDTPAAPTILAVTFVGQGTVGLSWQDNAVGETGYAMERSDNDNTNFQPLAQLPPNTTNYWDNTVEDGLVYFYRVRAVAGSSSSAYSNEAVVQTGITDAQSRLLSGQTVCISPNPTSGLVNLDVDNQWIGETTVAVFDMVGRQAIVPFSEEKTSGQLRLPLDMSSLPSGVFWVKMVQGMDVGWFKVVKD